MCTLAHEQVQPNDDVGATSRAEHGIPDDVVVFACFNQLSYPPPTYLPTVLPPLWATNATSRLAAKTRPFVSPSLPFGLAPSLACSPRRPSAPLGDPPPALPALHRCILVHRCTCTLRTACLRRPTVFTYLPIDRRQADLKPKGLGPNPDLGFPTAVH